MELSKSEVVLSLAGRDQGMLNGKERKLENPKRKKAKHVRKVLRPDSTVAAKLIAGDKLLNSELRRELAVLGREFNVSTKEGSETWQKTT